MTVATKGIAYVLELKGRFAEQAKAASASLGTLRAEASRAGAAVGVVTAATVAAGAALVAMADDVTGAIDRIQTLSANSGLAASTIKGLESLAGSTGKSLKDLVPKDLPKRIEEARQGTGAAARGFEMLGLMADIQSGKLSTADQVLRATIDALGAIEDPTLRAAAAQEVFGAKSQELTSALRDAGDLDAWVQFADRYGTDVGPEAVATTARWQQSMQVWSMSSEAAKNAALPLIDYLADVVLGFSVMSIYATSAAEALFSLENPFSAGTNAVLDFAESYRDLNTELQAGNTELDKAREKAEALTGIFENGSVGLNSMLIAAAAGRTQGAPSGGSGPPPSKKKAAFWDDDIDVPQLEDDFFSAGMTARSAFERALLGDGGQRISGAIRVQQELQVEVQAPEGGLVAELPGFAETIFGGFASVMAGPVALLANLEVIPQQLDRLTQSVEQLPETLMSIPDLAVGLLDAITELPMELIKAIPELAMGIGDVVFTLFTYGFEAFALGLGEVLQLLPGQFAQELGDVLTNLFTELNPFDGVSGNISLGGNVGADIEDFLGIDVPFLRTGGQTASDGLAYLHKGERVLTASETRTYNQQRTYGDIHIHGDGYRSREQLRQLMSPYGPGRGLLTTGLGM